MVEFDFIPPMLTAAKWNALLDHGLEKEADYVIRRTATRFEAIDGSTGKIFDSTSDLLDVGLLVNSCKDELPTERIAKPRIALKGAFPVKTKILLDDDYLILDLRQAYLTLDADVDMIQIGTPSALQNQVEIWGGLLDGKKSVRSAGMLLNLYGSWCKILGTTFINGKQHGIQAAGKSGTYAWMNTIRDCYFSGITLGSIYVKNWVAYMPILASYFDGLSATVGTASGIAMEAPAGYSGGLWVKESFFYKFPAFGCLLRGSDNWVKDTYFWKIGMSGIKIASDEDSWATYGLSLIHI